MLNARLADRLYKRLSLRPQGCVARDMARQLQTSESDITAAADELARRGLIIVSGHTLTPLPWWDMDRLELHLNVPRLPENEFRQYCLEIDEVAAQLRLRQLPVLRPYTNETLIELLITVGAASALSAVSSILGAFVARVSSKKIPHIALTVTKRTRDGAEVVVTVNASTAEELKSAFQSLVAKMELDDRRPYPQAVSAEVEDSLFLSYRRADTREIAGRIYDRLENHFGPKSVFMDIDRIRAGFDFRSLIATALIRCRAALVLIGENWLRAERLNNPDDFVRQEIEACLRRKTLVIPLLVGSAIMPKAGDLPDSIGELAHRQAIRVDPGVDFNNHMRRVIEALSPPHGSSASA